MYGVRTRSSAAVVACGAARCSSAAADSAHEHRLTAASICSGRGAWRRNSAPCHAAVKLSHHRYSASRHSPDALVVPHAAHARTHITHD